MCFFAGGGSAYESWRSRSWSRKAATGCGRVRRGFRALAEAPGLAEAWAATEVEGRRGEFAALRFVERGTRRLDMAIVREGEGGTGSGDSDTAAIYVMPCLELAI